VTRDVVRQVRQRAQDRCEYCHLSASVYPLPFHVDHIKARQHGGLTVLENLAFSCLHCNRHKGPNLAGADPNTGELIRLLNPRMDQWAEHFEWIGSVPAGRTAIGRVTIQLLAINDPDIVAVREALSEEQAFPLE
jgi:HNH endonuclease